MLFSFQTDKPCPQGLWKEAHATHNGEDAYTNIISKLLAGEPNWRKHGYNVFKWMRQNLIYNRSDIWIFSSCRGKLFGLWATSCHFDLSNIFLIYMKYINSGLLNEKLLHFMHSWNLVIKHVLVKNMGRSPLYYTKNFKMSWAMTFFKFLVCLKIIH